MSDELTKKVNLHHKLLLGDPENFEDQPGLMVGMKEANKTLSEIRAVAICALGVILTGFLTAVVAMVYKHP